MSENNHRGGNKRGNQAYQQLKQEDLSTAALATWKKEKLLETAQSLELPNANKLSKDELIFNILRANEPEKKA